MKIHENARLQVGLAVLYAVMVGSLFVWTPEAFWIEAVFAMLVYCVLWKNIGYVLLSNLLLLVASVLLWTTEVDYMRMGSVQETRDWLPFAYVFYGLFILLPPLILVPVRNWLTRKERRRA
ncbi:hypothetical protein [Saccharibacillus alkalitolerans]|uniref:Uncharacterized protein n=1 Tax=Saccharibacillus alkalitolerans TaxID=2705290 RepID=A0ABX0FBX6_9BACL|nr:hypothetical protein [Saccharibacillus alkalitolerans]NGZ76979.1 hypothetical protein [Saccharibacillus alkalitolerans]